MMSTKSVRAPLRGGGRSLIALHVACLMLAALDTSLAARVLLDEAYTCPYVPWNFTACLPTGAGSGRT